MFNVVFDSPQGKRRRKGTVFDQRLLNTEFQRLCRASVSTQGNTNRHNVVFNITAIPALPFGSPIYGLLHVGHSLLYTRSRFISYDTNSLLEKFG